MVKILKAKQMKLLNAVALWLITIGAINWGLDRIANYNIVDVLVETINIPIVGQILYGAIALSGAYAVYLLLTKQLK